MTLQAASQFSLPHPPHLSTQHISSRRIINHQPCRERTRDRCTVTAWMARRALFSAVLCRATIVFAFVAAYPPCSLPLLCVVCVATRPSLFLCPCISRFPSPPCPDVSNACPQARTRTRPSGRWHPTMPCERLPYSTGEVLRGAVSVSARHYSLIQRTSRGLPTQRTAVCLQSPRILPEISSKIFLRNFLVLLFFSGG